MDKIRVFIPSFLDDFGLDMPSFRLYSHIVRRADTSGQCWESVEKMAKICKMDRKTAFKAFAFLQEHKLVSAEKRKGQTSVINLTDHSDWLPIPNQVQGSTRSGTTTRTRSGTTTRTRSGIGVVPDLVLPPVPDQVHKGNPLEGDPTKGNPREGRKEKFSFDSSNQNKAMQEVKTSSDGIADQENPTPLPPSPLSDAAIALKAKFEERFDRKTKAQWWERYVKHDDDAWRELLTDWAFSETNAANFKESLLIVQIDHLRKIPSPCERGNAINSLSNYIRHDDLVSFQTRVAAAVEYEKALAANPTIKQLQNTETQQEPYMPKVGEIDANGMVLMVDCRWEHYYPMKARFSQKTSDTEIIWGMINTHPPNPVEERCQKFLEKAKDNPERLAKLLTAKHLADSDFASYDMQAENFANAIDGLIAALNKEIEKLLQAV